MANMKVVDELLTSASRIGLTNEQTAALVGVCRQQLYFWKIGRNDPKPTRVPNLRTLAESLARIERDESAKLYLLKEPSTARLTRLVKKMRAQGAGNGR